MPDEITVQLLGTDQRSIWCGDRDDTGRFVCRLIREHDGPAHAGRNDAGGTHQWRVRVDRPAEDANGTVRVHPDDDRRDPAARRRIAVDDSDYCGPYEGCRWQRLTGVGIGDGGPDPLHSDDVAGWPVQSLAELAVVLGHPKAKILADLAVVYGYELGLRDSAGPIEVRPVPERLTSERDEALIAAVSARLADIAASGDIPYRQDIADAADALAGRVGAPGSPWDHQRWSDAVPGPAAVVLRLNDLLRAIWLHVAWRPVTRHLTTDQRELWADAVEFGEGPEVTADRWWRPDGGLVPAGTDEPARGAE